LITGNGLITKLQVMILSLNYR